MRTEQEQTKRCRQCGETKPASAFYRNPRVRDGLSTYCKPCHSARVTASRRRHPETAQRWRAAHRAEAVAAARKWRPAHPDRVRAQAQRALQRKGGVSRTARAARRSAILDRYVAGATLAAIGAEFGITRQSVQQTVVAEVARRHMRLVRAFRLVPIEDTADTAATPAEGTDDGDGDGEEIAAWAQ